MSGRPKCPSCGRPVASGMAACPYCDEPMPRPALPRLAFAFAAIAAAAALCAMPAQLWRCLPAGFARVALTPGGATASTAAAIAIFAPFPRRLPGAASIGGRRLRRELSLRFAAFALAVFLMSLAAAISAARGT